MKKLIAKLLRNTADWLDPSPTDQAIYDALVYGKIFTRIDIMDIYKDREIKVKP